MKTKKLCNLIILDASGSMADKSSEVRHGLKQLFKDIQATADIKNRTIVCDFASAGDFREVIDTKKPEKLTREIANSYRVRGMTALYDAIAHAFSKVNKTYDGVFVSIMTDGLENNSQHTSLEDVKKLIANKRKKGWAITFMGTTESALKEAGNLGIADGNMYKYEDSAHGAAKASERRSRARMRYADVMRSDIRGADVVDRLMGEE